jgi:hypothetical protein
MKRPTDAFSTNERNNTIAAMKRAIEYAPVEAKVGAVGLVGWWTPDNVYVCASCAARMMARGCLLLRGSTPVWKDGRQPTSGCALEEYHHER